MKWTSISTQGITGGKGNLKEFLYYPDPVSRGNSELCAPTPQCFQATAALPSQQGPDPPATLSCHCPGAEVTTLLLPWTLASTAGQEHNKEG